MDLVFVVAILAVIQFLGFGILVGMARGKYDVPAPAVTGNPTFERYNRVQQNTLEQLAIFLPAMFMYAYLGDPRIAAGLGAVYLIGRLIYLRSYVKEPKSRGLGFAVTSLPSMFMLLASMFMAVRNLIVA